jgi:3-oxoacyl-[acyl-carrier-protein] synthase-3
MIEQREGRGARFAGIGYYLPEVVLTNADFERMVDTSDEWIVTRTGIRERRIARADQASSDLAIEAAQRAMADAGVTAGDIEVILVGTATPDMLFPATACLVQDRIGAKQAAAFDITAACSGFIYGVTIIHSMIAAGKISRGLVIGVETLSRILDYRDRATCVLFGDGAGAVVMEACDPSEGVLSTHMKSDGTLGELLYLPGGGSRRPLNEERLRNREQYVKMKGDGLFKYAVKMMVEASERVLADAKLEEKDIDFLVPHQANIRIIQAVRQRLGVPEDKMIVNIDRIGNTSAASIPIALGEAKERGLIKRGDRILMVGFGGGVTWGAILMKY